jgi:hypothetical protein
MERYKKRPIVVEAEPYVKGMEDGVVSVHLGEVANELIEAWHGDVIPKPPAAIPQGEETGPSEQAGVFELGTTEPAYQIPVIDSPEGGRHFILPTDIIVTGIAGERYPVRYEIFEATYESDPQGALPKEIEVANKYLKEVTHNYYALGRFIHPLRNQLGVLGDRWDRGERTLQICQEIMAVKVPTE